jgi:PAS domain S-box-containing protein
MAQHTPIKRRLSLVILLASLTVMLLTSAGFIISEVVASRRDLERNVRMAAQMIADQASSSLMYRDEADAREVLSSLRFVAHIESAALYNTNGLLFAYYPTNASPSRFPAAPPAFRKRLRGGILKWAEPVMQLDRRAGTLYIESNLGPVYERLHVYAVIGTLVMSGSLLVAYFLSNSLQKGISQPILQLAETARIISERHDYTVRARKLGEDEVGLLTDAFNHMLGQIQDSEAALRDSAERLQLALQASQTGTWDWHIQGNRMSCDPSMDHQFGLSAGQFEGTFEGFLRAIHPEDRPAVQQAVQRAIEQHQELNVELRVIWPDGSVHFLVNRGKALYNDHGQPVRMTGVSIEITERKRSEEAHALMAAIVASSEDAIIGKDLQGRVISWNAGAARMFGYSAEEILGQPATVLTAPDRPNEESEILARIRRGEHLNHYETVRIRKDGQPVCVSLSVSPIRNRAGEVVGVSSISRDITERKRAEEEIRRLNAELEARVRERTAQLTETNHELEAFTYSVSHDLRAPLRHIDAFARIVEEELTGEVSPTLRNYISRIRRGTQTMGRLVDDLLNLSRVGRAELGWQRVDLHSLVEEVVSDLKAETAQRQIDWRVGPLPTVECDPGLMRQVFANLLSNAVKYTRPRPQAVIEIGQLLTQDEHPLFVRDNGVGFNMKYVGKLFGVFERLHRPDEFEGTGIGLATVRRIILKHRGRVWAEAEPDKGATFYFTLAAGSHAGTETAPNRPLQTREPALASKGQSL